MREGTGHEEERRMSDLKFIYVTGEWKSTGTPPENNKEKFYIVSLYHTEGHWSRIPDCYWRHWENRWEFYEDGKWHDTFNPLYRAMAYMPIMDLEPYADPEGQGCLQAED